jgi:hypothetical protein
MKDGDMEEVPAAGEGVENGGICTRPKGLWL